MERRPSEAVPSITISCQSLTARFGDVTAVESFSLDVRSGAVCALLGANGAGKSTTVKMMTGLLRPTSGDAIVAGHSVVNAPLEVKRRIGALPENLGLFDSLTVEEHLQLTGPVYGIGARETAERTTRLLRALKLEDFRSTYASRCSHGTRKKTALAMALLPNPDVLFLDEPFEGIDPVASRFLRDLLASLAGRGITVFLTSHILPIVEKLASQVVMIRSGRVVWNSGAEGSEGRLEELYFSLAEAPVIEELEWLGSRRS